MSKLARIILVPVSAMLLFPLFFMLANSFMKDKEVISTYTVLSREETQQEDEISWLGFKLIPEEASLIQYYNVLFRRPKFLIMFWNSVIITLPIVLGQMLVSSLAAYAFSKLRFPLRDKIFYIYIVVMLMPFQVTLVPNYIMLDRLRLIGTFTAVILPGVFSTFGVFLLRQFMLSIPYEYCEAAKIDGSGYLRTFSRIILPQCKAGIASLAILSFIDNWNMVEQPLIFLKDSSMHPLSIFMNRINQGELGLAFACGIIYMIPTIIIFIYGENYLVQGIQLSGIK